VKKLRGSRTLVICWLLLYFSLDNLYSIQRANTEFSEDIKIYAIDCYDVLTCLLIFFVFNALGFDKIQILKKHYHTNITDILHVTHVQKNKRNNNVPTMRTEMEKII